jgi:hypothetical protein
MKNEFNKRLMASSGIGKKLETASYSYLTIVGKDNGEIQIGFDDGLRYVIGTYNPKKIVFDEEGKILEVRSGRTLIAMENIDERYKEACKDPVGFYNKYLNQIS